MKAWQKGAIIGGAWGLISGVLIFFMAIGTAMAGGSLMPQSLKDLFATLIVFLFLMPGYLSLLLFLLIFEKFGRLYIPFTNFDMFVLIPIVSIVLGSSIANIIALAYAKKVKGEDNNK